MALDEASFLAASGRRFECRVGDILNELDDEDRATLLRVLANPKVSVPAIVTVMTEAGHEITAHQVKRHRDPNHRCPA